jgi:DNA-binding FrmR family transcriptional regulator
VSDETAAAGTATAWLDTPVPETSVAGQAQVEGQVDAPAYVVSGDKAKVLARLRRIEGQVRGLQRMVDDDTYCIDVLTQISAATSALESVALQLLDEHLRHCVRHAIEGGGDADAKIAEASAAVARLVRS